MCERKDTQYDLKDLYQRPDNMSSAFQESSEFQESSAFPEYFCVYCEKDFQYEKDVVAHLKDETTECYVINEDRKVNHPRTAELEAEQAARLEAEIAAVEKAAAELAESTAELVAEDTAKADFEICKPERQPALCQWLHKETDAEDGFVYYYTRDDNVHPDVVTEEYTGVRNYICRECCKIFYDKKYLKTHISKFDKEKNECTKDDMWKYN